MPKAEDSEALPQLHPYRPLDVSRLKIVGQGSWDTASWLDGQFWLPYLEPAILCHNLEVDLSNTPDFGKEVREDYLELSRLWDSRGLLHLEVFNAYKDLQRDRQIGDRRLPNALEFSMSGPSKALPAGWQFCALQLTRRKEGVCGYISDRKDFYHQCRVSSARAASNATPFGSTRAELQGCAALARLDSGNVTDPSQPTHKPPSLLVRETRDLHDGVLTPCFRSLFQGDHLGVEFALEAHSQLLQNHGALPEDCRLFVHVRKSSSSRVVLMA